MIFWLEHTSLRRANQKGKQLLPALDETSWANEALVEHRSLDGTYLERAALCRRNEANHGLDSWQKTAAPFIQVPLRELNKNHVHDCQTKIKKMV